ncbi:hypothetical protein QJQ45_023205 [Haematococcus lacustris]|nr:hypothetical protein QJQ45_023205 [Haematococcus lacustris]
MLKELRNLTPWQWDTRTLQHPPGAKSLSAFEKIDQAFLGSGGKTRSVSDAVQGLKRGHRSPPAPAEAKVRLGQWLKHQRAWRDPGPGGFGGKGQAGSGGTLTFHHAPPDRSPELHTPAVTCRITSPSTPLPAPSSPLTKPRSTPPPAASRCSAASDQPELLRLTATLDSQGPTPAHSNHHPAASYGTVTTSPPAFLAPSGCPSALTSPPPCPSPCSSACPGARGLKRGSEACSQPPQQVKVEGAAALSPAEPLLLAHTTPSQPSKRPRPCTSCTPGDSAAAASDTTACQLLLHGPGCTVPGARGESSRGDGSIGGGSRGVEGCSAGAVQGQQWDSLAVLAPARQQGGSSGSEQEVGGSSKLPCDAVLEVGVPRAGLTQCLEAAAAAAPCEQGDGGEGKAGAGEVVQQQQQQESAFVAGRPGTGQTLPGTKLTNPTPNCLAPSPSSTATAGAQRHLLDSLLQAVSTQATTTAPPAEPTVPLSSRAASPSPARLPLGHFCFDEVHGARMDSVCSPTAATAVAAAGLPATSSEGRSAGGLDREAGRCPCEQAVRRVAAAPTDPCNAVLVQQQSQQAAEQQQREDAAACLMSLAAAPHAVKAVEAVAPSPGCAAGPPPWLGPSVACLGNELPAQLHGPFPYSGEPAAMPAQQLVPPLAPITAAHVQVQQLVQLLTRLQQVGQVPGGLATAHQLLVQQAMQQQQQEVDRVYRQNQPLQLSQLPQPTQQQQLRRYGDCEALDAPAVSRGCAGAVAKGRDRVHPPPNQPPASTKRTARAPHLPPGQTNTSSTGRLVQAVQAVHHEVEARTPFSPASALPQQGRGEGAEQRLGKWQCLPGPASSPRAMLPPATLPAAAACSPHTASKSPTPGAAAAAPAPGGASASGCAASRLPGSALLQPPSSALLALLTKLPCPITPQAPPAAAAAAPTSPAPPASSRAPLPDLHVALPPLAAPSPAAPPPLLPQPPQASAAGQGLGGGVTLHDLVQAVSGYCTAQGVAPTPGNVLKAQAVVQLLQEADVPGASTILQQLQQQAGQELAAAACGAEGRGVKTERQGGPDMLVTPAVVGTLAAPTAGTGADAAAHPSPAAAVAAGLGGPVPAQGTAAASVQPVAAVAVTEPTWPANALPLLPLHIAAKPDIHADWALSLHPAIVKVYADLQAAHSALRAACRPPTTHTLIPIRCSPAPLLAPAASSRVSSARTNVVAGQAKSFRSLQQFQLAIVGDLHLAPEQMPLFEAARDQLVSAMGAADNPTHDTGAAAYLVRPVGAPGRQCMRMQAAVYAGARVVQLGDLGHARHASGSVACFEFARAYLDSFQVPYSLVLGNHDLEGRQFSSSSSSSRSRPSSSKWSSSSSGSVQHLCIAAGPVKATVAAAAAAERQSAEAPVAAGQAGCTVRLSQGQGQLRQQVLEQGVVQWCTPLSLMSLPLPGEEFETDSDALQGWQRVWEQPYAWTADLGHVKAIGLSTTGFRSNPCSHHEVRIDDAQMAWFEQQLQESAQRPVLVFTHAPPQGCGLKVIEEVHVKNRCAWLNHSDRPARFLALAARYPNIRLWFSGHFHLSHNYKDSISVVGSTAFVQTGVIGTCNRDGHRHSRLLTGNASGWRLSTLDHDSGKLRADLAGSWDTAAAMQLLTPQQELITSDAGSGWLCSRLDCDVQDRQVRSALPLPAAAATAIAPALPPSTPLQLLLLLPLPLLPLPCSQLCLKVAAPAPPLPAWLLLSLLLRLSSRQQVGSGEVSSPQAQGRGANTSWFNVGPSTILALQVRVKGQDGQLLVEYDIASAAPIGLVCKVPPGCYVRLLGAGRQVLATADWQRDGSQVTAVEVVDTFTGGSSVYPRNEEGAFFVIYQPNKWKLKQAKMMTERQAVQV